MALSPLTGDEMLQPWLRCWTCSVQQFLSHTWAGQGVQPGHGDTRALKLQCPLPLQGLSPCLKAAHRHFKFIFLESTFLNDVVKHQPVQDQHPALPALWYLPSPSRHSCLQSHPPLTLLRLIPGKHLCLSPASLAPCAAGKGRMLHAATACWAHVWPARVPSRASDVGTPWGPNGKAKLSQPTQGRAGVWHHSLPRSARSKGLRPGERAEPSVPRRGFCGSVGGTRCAGHHQGVWDKRGPANLRQWEQGWRGD